MIDLFVLKQDENIKVSEEYTLDIIVQEIFERELNETIYHYNGDEFLEYGYIYLKELMPYYIKSRGTQLYSEDIINVVNIINNHYGYDSYNSYCLSVIEVDYGLDDFAKQMIEQIGLNNFMKIKNSKVRVK